MSRTTHTKNNLVNKRFAPDAGSASSRRAQSGGSASTQGYCSGSTGESTAAGPLRVDVSADVVRRVIEGLRART